MQRFFILPRADSPSIRQHPVASFQAAYFAKPASMPVYPAKPSASTGRKKGSNPQIARVQKAHRAFC